MEKVITIIEEDGQIKFSAIGFSDIEALGLLRYYEQFYSLKMLKENNKPVKKAKQ